MLRMLNRLATALSGRTRAPKPASIAAWTGLGLSLTPFLEYAWHAWIAHGSRPDATRTQHLEHHRTAHTVRDPWEEMRDNAARIAITLVSTGAVLVPIVGRRRSLSLTLGLAAGYALTTLYHAKMHERPPQGRYEEWMWRFHWHHHAVDARVNFGLTNPLFDFVFGTAVVPDEVTIPDRLVPVWLTHDRPGFRIRHRPPTPA